MKKLTMAVFAVCALTGNASYGQEGGAAEMARLLQNPLANIAAVITDNDIYFGTGDQANSTVLQVQPVYSLNFPEKHFTLIPRGVIPVMGVAPLATLPDYGAQRPAGGGTTWGLGDSVGQLFIAPDVESSWKWGIGPQVSFKTRTNSDLAGAGWGSGGAVVLTGGIGENIAVSVVAGNPALFYEQAETWQFANVRGQPVLPYYQTMDFGNCNNKEEFVMIDPMTPINRANLSMLGVCPTYPM